MTSHRVPYRIRAIIIVLLLLMLGYVTGAGIARVLGQGVELPRFEADACPFPEAVNQRCGFVVVPEVHSDPDSPEIRLAVVITEGDADEVPVMLLSGGPGEITTPNAGAIAGIFQQAVGGRTLIQFDQRGVGRSQPALACPEWVDAMFGLLESDPSPEEALRIPAEAVIACGERLADEGINLSAYNSIENAADVAAIAEALGYEQVDLLGVSYGSLLAQHVMRDHPDSVRAVIIDSVLPLDASFFVGTADTAVSAIDRLLDACAADPACDAAYPDLRDTLLSVIQRYNDNPVPVTLTHPVTGETYDSLMYGDSILSTVVFFLYQSPVIPSLPSAIASIDAGDLSLAETLQSQFLVAYTALERGMQYAVFCAEDLLNESIETYAEALAALPPPYRGRADLEDALEYSPFYICENFPVETLDPNVKTPLQSDIPVLVFSGEYDPVTPREYAERVAEGLSSSFVYTFPGVGHSVTLASECARGIVDQFLDDPASEPDASCIDSMGLTFNVPGLSIGLETFESSTFGIRGVIPAGWQELAPGVYAESATSSVAIIQQSAPMTMAALQSLLSQQFGIPEFPSPSAEIEANGLRWSIYETTGPAGLLADVALAEQDGTAYVIVLLSTTLDRANYLEGLFFPAIDALVAQ
jgi:pimeloyl-ACP methyl ester carboxylesterase